VRAIDVGALESGGDEPGDDEPGDREVLRVRVRARVKSKWGDVKRTLRRVTGEWLPTEACVEWVAAEVLPTLGREVDPGEPAPLARRVRTAATDSEDGSGPTLPPAAAATASPFVASLVAGLDGADARELDRRLCRAAALERGLLARLGPLLLAFADLRGPLQLGFRSLDAYARERLGMSPRKARALLRLERACTLAPVLGAAWREGRITGSQAFARVPLFLAPGSEPFHAAWIERTAEVTVRRLEDDVEHALVAGAFDPALLPDLPRLEPSDPGDLPDPLTLPEGVQIGARPMAREETDVWVANVPADVARLFRACLCSVARRLGASPGRALEAMSEHAVASWWVPTPRAYRVFARDGFRCTVPGCTSQRNLPRTTCCSARRAGATTSPI